MESIYTYFETIPPAHRSMILVSEIVFFWVLEYMVPLFQLKYKKFKHAGINIFFTPTTILVNFPLAFLLLKTSDWAIVNNFGILQWLPIMPLWLKILLGVMLLDLLSAWLAYWVEHKVKVYGVFI